MAMLITIPLITLTLTVRTRVEGHLQHSQDLVDTVADQGQDLVRIGRPHLLHLLPHQTPRGAEQLCSILGCPIMRW